MDAITKAYNSDIQMIDSTFIREHQQAATAKKGGARSLSRFFPRRSHDQDPRGRRPARSPDPTRPKCGASARCLCCADPLDWLDPWTIILVDKAYDGNAIRYDKLANSFLDMIKLAPMRLWLRSHESTT